MVRFFYTSFSWLEEFSRYIFIFATFLGAAIAISMDKHPRMSALQTALGPKRARWLILLSDIVCAGIAAYLCTFAVQQVQNLMRMKTITSAMSLPLWTVYVIIPLSMVGMTIRFALLIIKDINVIRGKVAIDSATGVAAEIEAEIQELKGGDGK